MKLHFESIEVSGDNELLDEQELVGYSDPFNISLGAVVYRMIDKRFAELLNQSADPESPLYNQVSASWEIGFNDYQIEVGSDNLAEAEIITDENQKSLLIYRSHFV